jgi:hypothetical protein
MPAANTIAPESIAPESSAPASNAPESIASEKHRGNVPPFLWRIFVGLSLLLLAGSVIRAVTYPFLHDESLSFAIFTIEPRFGLTANHHLLNTWAMEACARLFGTAEWQLRLPSLLAHLVYLGAVLALLRRLAHPAIQIFAFVALNLNPWVLDYLFQARGYAIGLAALMVGLVLLIRGFEEKDIARRRRWLLGALGAGAVAVLANYSFLFFYLTLHGIVAILYCPRGARRGDLKMVAAVLLSGIFLAFVYGRVRSLASRGELYFGGSQGFFQDTVRSVIEGTLYRIEYPHALMVAAVLAAAGLFVAAIGAGVWQAVRGRVFTLPLAFAALLTGAALVPILSHAFGQSLLPIERAALQYMPLAVTAFVFALSELWRARPAKWIARGVPGCALLLAIAGTAHFAISYNVAWTYGGFNDSNDKIVLSLILRDQQERGSTIPPRLTVTWNLLPTFSFYHATLPERLLASVKNLRNRTGEEEYAYVLECDAAPLVDAKYSVLARFANTETLLLRHPKMGIRR